MTRKKTASNLSAAVDWRSYGATSFVTDRIQRVFEILDQHGEPLDAGQLAQRLPVNPRTQCPVDPRTVQVWLQLPVAEHALVSKQRGFGRPRDGRPTGRDTNLYEPDLKRLFAMRLAKPASKNADRKIAVFEKIDWQRIGLSPEAGFNIARVCVSIDDNPKMTIEERARSLGLGVSTTKTILRVCGRAKKKPENSGDCIRLDIIRSERRNDSWPRGASIRRVKWEKVKTLPRVSGAIMRPDLLRTLPVADRPMKGSGLDKLQNAIVLTRDFLAVEEITTVDQANAAKRILATIGDGWDKGQRALAAELKISRSTLEKHLPRLLKSGLITGRSHRKNGQRGPRIDLAIDFLKIRELPGQKPKAATKRHVKKSSVAAIAVSLPGTAARSGSNKGGRKGDDELVDFKEFVKGRISKGDQSKPSVLLQAFRDEHKQSKAPSKRYTQMFVSRLRNSKKK